MATVDPRYFDWGGRFQEGMEQSRQRRLQDIALGQQQEDRARSEEERQLRLGGLRQQQAAQQAESQYAAHLREATTLLNAAKALKGVPLERRRQALEQWGQRNQIIAGALKHIPPETDLSDAGLDEFAASMGIAVQGYGQPQGNSDFLRAIEIIKNPNASPQERQAAEVSLGLKARAGAEAITPYQQAQLDIANRRATAAESAATAQTTRATSGKADQALQKYTAKLDTNQMPQIEEMLTGVEGMLRQYSGKDVPGFGATGAAPQFMLSEEGQNARQSLAGLANTILKSRSGAAVTNPEMARFLTEVGSGALMKDERVRQGIAQIRKWFNEQKRNLAASLPEEAKQRYIEQGGSDAMFDFGGEQKELSDDDLINKYLR